MNVDIRPYDQTAPGEGATLYGVFFEAARIGARDHYTEGQRKAWAPFDEMPNGWADKLAQMQTWVAEVDGEIAGFMGMRTENHPDGYLDLAFVRPRWMGRGVAQALYGIILERARARGLTRLTTHASHLARPFFARQGWRVDYPETVERDGETLERFAMSLDLRDFHDKTNQP
ncbi:MAG: GNAT family N-acetyltransferase [Rhodobacteraceae bacterium]|nr:GNAT family N-acetyltransferase [Paracoccaceae bacterium]